MFEDDEEEVERLSYGEGDNSLKKSFNKSGDNLSEGYMEEDQLR
jgi:hypothetical protein